MTLEAARHGGFAAAARTLGVDPSVVSRAVARLEREIEVRLFDRSTRRLAATEAGARFLTRAGPLLAELESAVAEARDLAGEPVGVLRLTASVAFGQAALAPELGPFRAAYPKIGLELELYDRTADLIAERIDLAIRLGARPTGDLIASRWRRVSYAVVASPEYVQRFGPLGAPIDLAGRDCLRLPFEGFRSVWRFRPAAGGDIEEVAISGAVIISSPAALAEAARNGLGPALLPDWLIRGDLASGALVELLPDFEASAGDFESGIWFAYPSRSHLPKKTRVMIDFLRASSI